MTCFAQAHNVLTHIHTHIRANVCTVLWNWHTTLAPALNLLFFCSSTLRSLLCIKLDRNKRAMCACVRVYVHVSVPWYMLHGMPSTSICTACMWVNKFQIKLYRTHIHVHMKRELEHEHKRNIDMCLWLKYSRDTTLTPNLSRTSHSITTSMPTLTFWATHTQTNKLCMYLLSVEYMLKSLLWSCFSTFFHSLYFVTLFCEHFPLKRNMYHSRQEKRKYDKIW